MSCRAPAARKPWEFDAAKVQLFSDMAKKCFVACRRHAALQKKNTPPEELTAGRVLMGDVLLKTILVDALHLNHFFHQVEKRIDIHIGIDLVLIYVTEVVKDLSVVFSNHICLTIATMVSIISFEGENNGSISPRVASKEQL